MLGTLTSSYGRKQSVTLTNPHAQPICNDPRSLSFNKKIVLRALPPILAVTFALLSFPTIASSQQPVPPPARNVAELYQNFLRPPGNARPMVRWWWFGVAVRKPEILRELQQMKADGIGGVELAFVYPQVLNDPSRGLENLPFLSPQMLQAVTYAQEQARKLGLRVDVTLCSGWPYGGPSTSLDDAAGHLRTVSVALASGDSHVATPPLANGESIVSVEIANGAPGHRNAKSAHLLKLQHGTVQRSTGQRNPHRPLLHRQPHPPAGQARRCRSGGICARSLQPRAVANISSRSATPLVRAFGSHAAVRHLLRFARSLRSRLDPEPSRRVSQAARLRPHTASRRASRRRLPGSRQPFATTTAKPSPNWSTKTTSRR